jgi:predicted aspartyl protease
MGLEGKTYSLQKAPDHVIERINIGPLSYTWAHTGEEGWIMDQSGAVRALSDIELEELLLLSKVAAGSPMDEELRQMMVMSDSLSDAGHVCILLGKRTPPIQLYFNRDTWLLEMVRLTKLGMPLEATFADFRWVSGIKLPFKGVQSVGGMFNLVIEVDSLFVNVPAPDSLFWRPGMNGEDASAVALCMMPIDVHTHILVPVQINSEDATYFILDSGAGMSCISRQYARALQLETHGTLPAQGVVGYDSVAIASVDSMIIGCVREQRSQLAVVDLSLLRPEDGSRAIDGILGYGFFSKQVVAVVGDADSITIAKDIGELTTDGYVDLPLQFVANVPAIQAEINGRKGEFLLDTGNSFALILHTPFATAHGIMPAEEHLLPMPAAGIGGTGNVYSGIVDSIAFGGNVIRDVPTLFSPKGAGVTSAHEVSGNIGLALLRRFDWIMDYESGTLYLKNKEGI